MNALFEYNRSVVLFVYGQVFFTLGMAIFFQSRRHSRLKLARDLRWLAAFGVLHGIHEWGILFIPIQADYLSLAWITGLQTIQIALLGLSFGCLLMFGSVTISPAKPLFVQASIGLIMLWIVIFFAARIAISDLDSWYSVGATWARYLMGLPGAVLAAWGLYTRAQSEVIAISDRRIYRMLQIAVVSLLVYAFWGGAVVRTTPFFPANTLNQEAVENLLGIPVEVFRSLSGLALTLSMIRALEMFDIEVDRMIESMEIEQIRSEERDRIGQEIHDGAIQSIYSAGLLVRSAQQHAEENPEVAVRLDRAQQALESAVVDLRQYMISLRADQPLETLADGLRQLATDPRFSSLLDIHVQIDDDVLLMPAQVGYALSIAQESLANAARHAHARHVTICLCHQPKGVSLRIEDDGRGFDPATVVYGFGLRAMRDRARMLGHPLRIHSQPDRGTTIDVLIVESEENKP